MFFRIVFAFFIVIQLCSADFLGDFFGGWFNPKKNNTIGNLKYSKDLPFSSGVYGVVLLDHDVYLIRQGVPSLIVLSANLTLKMTISYPGFSSPYDLVYLEEAASFFLLEWTENGTEIFRVDVGGKFNVTKWPYAGSFAAGSLSVTSDGHLLVVNRNGTILELSAYGRLLRSIRLDVGADVRHAIKLSSKNLYAVAMGIKPTDKHMVCLFDVKAKQVGNCFGNEAGSDNTQLNAPWRLMEEETGKLLVADMLNKRVVELDANLRYNRTLLSSANITDFANPQRFAQSKDHCRLFYVANNNFDEKLGYPPTGKITSFNY